MKMLKTAVTLVVMLAFTTLFLTIPSHADIPRTINYQGKLTTPGGTPVPDSTYSITFRIYEQQSGGSPLWYETQSITVQKGIFSTQIGATKDLNLSFDKPYYLGIQVGSDTEMTPRQALSSAAYAFRADSLQNILPVSKGGTGANDASCARTNLGIPTPGSVVQVVNYQTGAVTTGSRTIPHDDTIPQNTEGDEYMTLTITPTNANNKLKIEVVWNGSHSAGGDGNMTIALFQDNITNALAATSVVHSIHNMQYNAFFIHYMTAGTTNATTFKVRAGFCDNGTTTFNGRERNRRMGGVMASSITITEIQS